MSEFLHLVNNSPFVNSIYRAAPLGIGIVVERVFVEVNDYLCRMVGFSRGELIGKSARMIYPTQEEFDRVGREKYGQIHSQGVGSIETRWRRKDGRIIDVYLSSSAIDMADLSRGVVFTALDITDRKRAEENLRLTEASYRTLVEQVPAIIYVDNTDDVSSSIYVSPQSEKYLGYSPEEWLFDPDLWVKILHPDDRQRVITENTRTNQTGEPFDMEYRLMRKDGKVLWIRDQAVLEYAADGKPLFWRGIMMDITKEKEAELRLQASEDKFATAFHTSPDSVNINRLKDGLYLEINEGFTRLTGYTAEDVCGKTSLEINIWANPEDRSRLVKGLLENGVVTNLEAQFRCKDGRLTTALMSARVIEVDGEQCILSITRDISERKQRELEMEAMIKVSAAMRQANTHDEMLPILAREFRALFHAESVMIGLMDENTEEWNIPYADGSWSNLAKQRLPVRTDMFEREASDGILALDIREGRNIFEKTFNTKAGSLHILIQMMNTAYERVGWVCIGREEQFQERDLRILHTVTDIAASAIKRASLHEQTERRLRRLNALRIIDRSINASMELDFTLQVALGQVVDQLDVEAVTILTFRESSRSLHLLASRGYRPELIPYVYDLRDDPAFQTIINRKLTLLPDLSSSPLDAKFLNRSLGQGFLSYAAVPLISKGKIKGVMEVFKRATLHADMEWIHFLEALGEQVAIAMDNAELFLNLRKSHSDLRFAYEATLEGWSRALEFHDRETVGHTRRVTEITLSLAKAFGIPEEELVHIRRGALLHDIGKMAIPDAILNKPGALNEEEWELMRKHPQLALDMLSEIEYLKPALDIPYCHHEKWDGSGYPRRLKGNEIPLAARIFAVVDVWDALRSDRPYRSAWEDEKVIEYIRQEKGKHFDPLVVEKFLEVLNQRTSSPWDDTH